ncbi:MAG: MarR family transcriptional regulator [Sphingomonadales bacterium]|nr:MAG: MarR family transcriptional regulator [Sphingomonadales bacterium]
MTDTPTNASDRLAQALEVGTAVTSAHFALTALLEQIHGRDAAGGRRALLLNLHEKSWTVPQLAAMRPVSRQYIQKIINELVSDGLVVRQANPVHKRSPLYRLTREGQASLEDMLARETPIFAELARDFDQGDVAATARVLWELRVRVLVRLE